MRPKGASGPPGIVAGECLPFENSSDVPVRDERVGIHAEDAASKRSVHPNRTTGIKSEE